MLAKVLSGATVGLASVLVEVEVDISARSLPSFTIVGLPGKAVEESKERVRAALQNIGAKFPEHRIIVNLTPADLPKEGPAYDLPIALGILVASGQLNPAIKDSLFLGELSLDGSLRNTKGGLSVALMAKEKAIKKVFLPEVNIKEAAVVRGIEAYPVSSLIELWHHLLGQTKIRRQPLVRFEEIRKKQLFEFDLSEIVGQESAKRVLEIAAAGNHNLFMSGPPGAGKTLLSRTLPSILPKMTEEESLETTKIYSVAGQTPISEGLITYRPFRSPHHTVSRVGLIGGGSRLQPGEISLAHRGVLFLDEFPEFPRSVLEALRQPMEDGVIQITRAAGTLEFPAKFLLIAAANPCPCGYYGSAQKPCRCSAGQIARYKKRISGPIIDRIDLQINVPEVKVEKLIKTTESPESEKTENSSQVQERIQQARLRQLKRFRKYCLPVFNNGELTNKHLKAVCPLDIPGLKLLHQAVSRLGLSARAYYKIIKVARTIADLEDSDTIQSTHLAEALQYRLSEEVGL